MHNLTVLRSFALALTTACVLAAPLTRASAQTPAQPTDCVAAAGKAEPATPPAPAADGTAPGNTGSTGWTGGTGGAFIGTNPQGATMNSTTWQPPTARGLDLAGRPELAAGGC